jgi:hypothetical protein
MVGIHPLRVDHGRARDADLVKIRKLEHPAQSRESTVRVTNDPNTVGVEIRPRARQCGNGGNMVTVAASITTSS